MEMMTKALSVIYRVSFQQLAQFRNISLQKIVGMDQGVGKLVVALVIQMIEFFALLEKTVWMLHALRFIHLQELDYVELGTFAGTLTVVICTVIVGHRVQRESVALFLNASIIIRVAVQLFVTKVIIVGTLIARNFTHIDGVHVKSE